MSAADTAIAEALAAGEAAQRRVADGDGTTTASGGGDAGGDEDDPMQTTPPKQRKKRCALFCRQAVASSRLLVPGTETSLRRVGSRRGIVAASLKKLEKMSNTCKKGIPVMRMTLGQVKAQPCTEPRHPETLLAP